MRYPLPARPPIITAIPPTSWRRAREGPRGYLEARATLAERYYYGKDGEEQDYAKTVLHTRLGAEQGHMEAQETLAILYELGEGVKKDSVRAAHWYAKAAEQGDVGAKQALARVTQ